MSLRFCLMPNGFPPPRNLWIIELARNSQQNPFVKELRGQNQRIQSSSSDSFLRTSLRWVATLRWGMSSRSVHVTKRACSRAARIAARSTCSARHSGPRWAFRRNRKNRELWIELRGVAFWAFGLLLAINERFKLMVAFLTYIFKNGHDGNSKSKYH